MPKSATDIMQDIINAAVVDAIVALKDSAKGLPNALLRDMNAVHANTAAVQAAVAASVRDAFGKLRKEGYAIAETQATLRPPRPAGVPITRRPGGRPPARR
jgi:hypothetical protein